MSEYYKRGYTPKPKPAKRCKACSLADICLPKLIKSPSVADYIRKAMEEITP
jgi:CRISPR-associated exonuclease Cas4